MNNPTVTNIMLSIDGSNGLVDNAYIYDFASSIQAAKFPMSVNTTDISDDLTSGIEKLAMSGKGEGHDNWLNGIRVAFDLTFSNKAWVEMERYHFIDFVSSQSTMHRIAKFDYSKTYNEYVDPRIKDVMRDLLEQYNANPTPENYLKLLYSNPAGFKLTARLTTNYRQLKTIYSQRKDHRLPEWREFCKWIEGLPYSYLITGNKNKEDK